MNLRKEVRELSQAEKNEFITALLSLKKKGIYDAFVKQHLDAMGRLTPMKEPPSDPGASSRNSAHRGPSFLPWHRIFLVKFEEELKKINSKIALPYWDWTLDFDDPISSPTWAENFMGPSGDENHNFIVTKGPFAYDNGWTLIVDTENGGNALRRRFGVNAWYDSRTGEERIWRISLPARQELIISLSDSEYDKYPWDSAGDTEGFRNRIEGWCGIGMPNLGPQLHNKVHVFIGGSWVALDQDGQQQTISGTMQLGSSPNDPIFFLHHAYVDKIWELWRKNQEHQKYYEPTSNGPYGHNLDDPMYPFTESPRNCISTSDLGYEYTNLETIEMFSFEKEVEKFDQGDMPPPGVINSHFLPGHLHH